MNDQIQNYKVTNVGDLKRILNNLDDEDIVQFRNAAFPSTVIPSVTIDIYRSK